MKIKSFSILNYKNLSKFKVELNKNLTTIVGENGSGKTNFFDAIFIFFDKHNYNKLDENSFNANLKNYKGNWIIFSAEISDIGDTAEEAVILKDDNNNGIVNLFFRPKIAIRRKMNHLSVNYINEKDEDIKSKLGEELKEFLNNIDVNYDYEVVYTQYCIFDLNSDIEYSQVVGDFDNLVFPNPNDDDALKVGNSISVKDLLSICNITYVPAIRNATKEFMRNQNILYKLVKEYTSDFDASEWQEIQKAIKGINESLENIKSLNDFSGNLNEQVQLTVGNIYNQGLGYKILLSEDSNEIIKNFELISLEHKRKLPIENRSLGENNITFFALKLMENRMLFETNRSMLNIILIEEPEAHIHKHLQKSLFSGVRNIDGNQIIMSTHSVYISESSNISKVRVFVKKNFEIMVCNPSFGMDEILIQTVERYLDSKRIPILFSKNVILVEGTAELLLIPKMMKLKYNLDLDELGISLVSMDSAFFKPISSLFSRERIRLHCSIITDEDCSLDYGSETKEGENSRIKELNELAFNNPFLSIHTTKHTFEVDLLENNFDLILSFISEQKYYKKNFNKFKNDMIKLKNSDRILRFLSLLNRVGKGWFAMDLVKYLDIQIDLKLFNIPSYILDAIAIAIDSSDISNEVVLNIINRSSNISKNDYFIKLIQGEKGNE